MNILLIILVILALWRGISGVKKGMAKEIYGLFSLVVALFILSLFILLYTSIKEKDTINIVLSVVMILITGLASRLVGLLMKSIGTLARLPVLSFFDSLLGAAVGVTEVAVGLWIVYVVIASFDTGGFGQFVLQQTSESNLLLQLYDMNQVAYWMAGL